YDYTHDMAGLPGAVSAASPRWLRLTRSGDRITGYDSADGRRWDKIGTVSLAGLPSTVQAGLFATSPSLLLTNGTLSCRGAACSGATRGQTFASNPPLVSYSTQATAAFDHVSLHSEGAAGAWRGSQVGFPTGIPFFCTPSPGHSCPRAPAGGFKEPGGTFPRAGAGDLARHLHRPPPRGAL